MLWNFLLLVSVYGWYPPAKIVSPGYISNIGVNDYSAGGKTDPLRLGLIVFNLELQFYGEA